MSTPSVKSCLSCPSRLSPSEAVVTFGKSVSSPMCAVFGYVLGRPGADLVQNNATEEAMAEKCPSYGDARPTNKPTRNATEVVLPDPDARVALPGTDPKKTIVRACQQCANFIREDVVAEEFGWTAGLCAAKGRLIPGNKKVEEAKGCDFRQSGPPRTKVMLPLLPRYTPKSIAGIPTPAAPARTTINPLDHPTDREVTAEEEKEGIISWRKISDPEGTGNFVMLPIFDFDSFSPSEQALIPQTGDDEHPELYHDHNGALYQFAVLWMELDEVPFAWGMPGVGKTEIIRHIAWLMGLPFYRFSIKEATELYEFEGSKEFADGKTYFREGRFVKAWKTRCAVVVDEPNVAKPDLWQFLRPCFDNSKSLVIDSDEGQLVPRNGFCFVGLAGNPDWSPLNVGTNPIGAADASRLVHIWFGYPREDVERQIIRERVTVDNWDIDKARLDFIFTVSNQVRALVDQGTLMMSWGIRENIKVARMLRWFEPLTAYRMAAGNYLEPQQSEAFMDQIRTARPSFLPPIQMKDKEES